MGKHVALKTVFKRKGGTIKCKQAPNKAADFKFTMSRYFSISDVNHTSVKEKNWIFYACVCLCLHPVDRVCLCMVCESSAACAASSGDRIWCCEDRNTACVLVAPDAAALTLPGLWRQTPLGTSQRDASGIFICSSALACPFHQSTQWYKHTEKLLFFSVPLVLSQPESLLCVRRSVKTLEVWLRLLGKFHVSLPGKWYCGCEAGENREWLRTRFDSVGIVKNCNELACKHNSGLVTPMSLSTSQCLQFILC